jgi:hypothetical protein
VPRHDVALGDDADEVPLGVEHRSATRPPTHQLPEGDDERLVVPERHDVAGHDVSHVLLTGRPRCDGPSACQEHWSVDVSDDLVGDAAQEPAGNATSPVRRHDDRVDVRGGCCLRKLSAHRGFGFADDRPGFDRDTGRAEASGDSLQVGGGRRDALRGSVGDPHQHKRRSRRHLTGNVQSALSQGGSIERDQEPIERRLAAMIGRRGAHQEDRERRVRHQRPGDTAEHDPLETATAVAGYHDRRSRKLVREVEQGESWPAVTHDRLDLQAGLGKLLLNRVQVAPRLLLLGLQNLLVHLDAHRILGSSAVVRILHHASERQGQPTSRCELRRPGERSLSLFRAVKRYQ